MLTLGFVKGTKGYVKKNRNPVLDLLSVGYSTAVFKYGGNLLYS